MSEPPLPPPLSPLVRNTLPANLVRNRIELLKTAEDVFRKYADLIPMMQEYLKQILALGKNIHVYVGELEPPEQVIWNTRHKRIFDPVFPAIERYSQFLGVLIKIMVLDQTTIYTHELLMHLMILLIGEELTQRDIYSERAVEQIGETFMYTLDLIREFFRRRNICLSVLSESLVIDSRLLVASEHRGSITFLIQFVAVDLMNDEHTWRALYILARQEQHVAAILHRDEIAKRLAAFMKTLEDEISENSTVRRLETEKKASNAKAKKNAENAAKAEANRLAREIEQELLKEEEQAKAAAAGKAEKEKKKREEKAARKAAEKAEADRIAAAEAAEKAAADAAKKAETERIVAEKKVAKNAIKKSSDLLAASMKKRAPELMTTPQTKYILGLGKKTPSASPPVPAPAPSPSSLPSSVSPTTSITPPLPPAPAPSVLPLPPSASPPSLSNIPRAPTPSLAKIGFTPYSRSPPVTRFWETLDHKYIYQLLYDLFIRTDNPDARFYLKGSAAIHMYKKVGRAVMINHTSDYDTTLLINPGLSKTHFYNARSYMLNIIVNRLVDAIDDPRFNAEVITKLHSVGIPFASFAYFNAARREPVYAIQDKIPQEHVSVPDKSAPKFYSDGENHFPYASFAAKPSTNVLNLRILRALERPKNITVLQLYTKTSPEIKLVEVTVPFYEYEETETQISLAEQWKAADRINILDGVPVLSLPALKAEQQKLRTLKDAAEIDRRIADINALMKTAGGAGSTHCRTRKRR